MGTYEIRHYLDANGNDLYQDWIEHLRDRTAQVAIIRRIARMAVGQFGDHKHLQDGVWELRIDVGPGYRVYYGHVGNRIVVLTHGGDKGTQARDITRAGKLLKDWEQRHEN